MLWIERSCKDLRWINLNNQKKNPKMDLTVMSTEERIVMVRERQAYFSAVAEEYTSFADFIKTQDHWLSIMGIQ